MTAVFTQYYLLTTAPLGTPTAQNPAEKESFRLAVQKTINYLFDKTESTNADEFIQRFNQGECLSLCLWCVM